LTYRISLQTSNITYIGRLYLPVGLETNIRNKCYDKNVLFH